MPDPQWSEAIKAICVRRTGANVTADEIIYFVARKIARYKKPKHIVFVDQLPKTDKGEIDRAAVKFEQLLERTLLEPDVGRYFKTMPF